MNAAATLLSVAIATALAAAAGAVGAQDVQRCDGPDGKVTYANGPCPEGTRPVRTLPPAQPPSAADQKAARERARQDQRDAEALDRARKAEDERAAREQDKAQAQAAKVEAQCRRLQSRLDAARHEVAGATSTQRADAQRRMRRAEQNYIADCGPLKD